MKALLRGLVPPIVLAFYRRAKQRHGYFGDYPSWEAARQAATGYDSEAILAKVKTALLAVKEGRAVCERDGVLFDEPQYSFPVIAALLHCANLHGGRLAVLDFGGSLGSTYFQCRAFLAPLQDVSWNIVEQPRFVAAGRETFQDDRLKFYDTMDACIQAEHPDLLLLSSVLGYLPDPMAFLAEAVARGFDIIVVDITPFSARGRRLTVQRVPPEIYEAAYPAWLLDEAEFLRAFEGKYELVSRYESLPSGYLDLVDARNLGFIFRRV